MALPLLKSKHRIAVALLLPSQIERKPLYR